MFNESDFQISAKAYEWTERALALLERVLKVNIKLHDGKEALEEGDIFVFNHFARFETFIPQYLIYRETGAFSRSVASAELFQAEDAFSRYLLSLGALPNDYKGLLPFLAAEVIRGRKVIIFPEGGMVKDRRVLDNAGRYSVYSRSSHERRKHHTGAAVVAQAVDAFKAAVRDADRRGQRDRLRSWSEQLGLHDPGELVKTAARPTTIVPSNITFYPLRITENPLRRIAELLHRDLSARATEELLVEGNILLRDTDMDLRMGSPLLPFEKWSWWDRKLLARVGQRIESLEDLFSMNSRPGGWDGRWLDRREHAHTLALRDAYMAGVYGQTTVNLSHLAARLILRLVESGVEEAPTSIFHRSLYLAVKNVQNEPSLHLHRSLRNPDAYAGLLEGHCPAWRQFLDTASSKGLVEAFDGHYRFLPKLREEQAFDKIRLENPVTVYANEVAPLAAATQAVDAAADAAAALEARDLARLRFEDQLRSYRWDQDAFRKPRHEDVNREERFTESGAPFFSLPAEGGRRLGVLLVHGFTASPAEIQPLADRLIPMGYPCLGVRLKGHGTSPWDLLERGWDDWLASVREGYTILSALVDRVCVVGFSAGAALALCLAADPPPGFGGVAAICTPLLWREKAMSLVPVVHGANQLIRHLSTSDGVFPFYHGAPEHPGVNYLHKPVEALYELQKLVGAMSENLGRVHCPVLLLQATDDPTVDPESADLIYQRLGTAWKTLVLVPSSRHGILFEGIGGTHERVIEFLARLEEEA
jgi:esterase/lipase